MSNRTTLRVMALFLALTALAACDTIKSLTGGSSDSARQQSLDAADEFGSKRPPLTLPPDYSLRPPAVASASSATDFTPAQQGRQAVFGLNQEKDPASGIQSKAGRTIGESALLQHAGAVSVDPTIRKKVDQESTTLAVQEKTFVDDLVKPGAGPADDAKKSDSGFLGGIFDNNNNKKPTMERKDDSGIF